VEDLAAVDDAFESDEEYQASARACSVGAGHHVRDEGHDPHRRRRSARGPTVAYSPLAAAPPQPRYQEVTDCERGPPSTDPLEATPPAVALVNTSPRQTRHRLAQAARGRIDATAFEELLFAVSEAVVNAHLFGRRPITVRAWTGTDRDRGPRARHRPRTSRPATGLLRAPGGSAGRGLGLRLIHQFTNIDIALLAAAPRIHRSAARRVSPTESATRTGTPSS
jgi:hypothetical protein